MDLVVLQSCDFWTRAIEILLKSLILDVAVVQGLNGFDRAPIPFQYWVVVFIILHVNPLVDCVGRGVHLLIGVVARAMVRRGHSPHSSPGSLACLHVVCHVVLLVLSIRLGFAGRRLVLGSLHLRLYPGHEGIQGVVLLLIAPFTVRSVAANRRLVGVWGGASADLALLGPNNQLGKRVAVVIVLPPVLQEALDLALSPSGEVGHRPLPFSCSSCHPRPFLERERRLIGLPGVNTWGQAAPLDVEGRDLGPVWEAALAARHPAEPGLLDVERRR
mmetsp:Transcript_13385/g.37972  ORF Transcript_13385/g.37972 Transcript_13385/m.37972 type:complete len:274 (-) Transcript_13385:418-1239(-)